MKKLMSLVLSIVMLMVCVTQSFALSSIPLKSIKLDQEKITLKLRSTVGLKVTYTPANTTQKALIYSTSNKNVVSVDKDGKITANAVGTAVITITSVAKKTITTKCTVTVPTSVDPLAKYSKTLKVTGNAVFAPWMGLDPGEDQNNNFWTKLYKDKLNIELTMKWTSSEWGTEFDQKFNTSMASDDMPDIMYAYSSLAAKAIKNGKVQSLTQVYEKYASDELKNLYAGDPNSMKAWTVKGELYGLSKRVRGFPARYGFFVRKDWLRALKLPDPKNFADVENVMKTFVKNNPGKQQGHYGLISSYSDVGGGTFTDLEPAFGLATGSWVRSGDKLISNRMQPQIKDSWKKFANWYKIGILAKDFSLKKNDTDSLQDWINGKAGVYFGYNTDSDAPNIEEFKKVNKNVEFAFVPLTKVDGSPAKLYAGAAYTDVVLVNKNFKNPEALIKIMNLGTAVFGLNKPSYIKDNAYRSGLKGGWAEFFMCFAYVEDPMDSVKNRLAAIEALKTGNTKKLNSDALNEYYVNLKGFKEAKKTDEKYLQYWSTWQNCNPVNGIWILADRLNVSKADYDYEPFWTADTETQSKNGANWGAKFAEFRTNAIMSGDVEGYYKKYVDFFKANGGLKATDEANAWYKLNK